jgi:hypothetical protein
MNFRQQIEIFNQNRQVSIQGSQFVKVASQQEKKGNHNKVSKIRNHFDINNSLKELEGQEKRYDDRIDTDLLLTPANESKNIMAKIDQKIAQATKDLDFQQIEKDRDSSMKVMDE